MLGPVRQVRLCVSLLTTLLLLFPSTHQLTDDEIRQLRDAGGITITESSDGSTLTLSSNGRPNHETGEFPGPHNPNSIATQAFSVQVPKNPTTAETPSCLPMGPIGLMASGAAFFNPYTSEKLDAVENEVFDECDGHPDQRGVYHYHDKPDCVLEDQGNSALIGVAFDGYPVYGTHDADTGNELTPSDLDECHGRTVNGRYRYHVTKDFPYILGCYRGNVDSSDRPPNMECFFAKNTPGKGNDLRAHAQISILLPLTVIAYKTLA